MIPTIIQLGVESAKISSRVAVRRLESSKERGEILIVCPHCGAPQKTRTNKCDYCDSLFNVKQRRDVYFIDPTMFGGNHESMYVSNQQQPHQP